MMKRSKQRSRAHRSSNPEQQPTNEWRESLPFRVNFVYGLIFISCASLIMRLGYLQVSKGQELRTQAMTSAVQTVPVLPARGRIYDTNGNLLAYDKPTYSVYFTRFKHVNDSPEVISSMARLLAPTFGQSTKAVVALLNANPQDAITRLFRNINDVQLSFITEHSTSLPGVYIQTDWQRNYPYGDLAGQVLGSVGPITPQSKHYYVDIKKYLTFQLVGNSGIEQQYEHDLQGKVGQEIQQYNAQRHQTNAVGYTKPPVSGYNLKLTLDGRLQADAQIAVMDAINQYQNKDHTQITDGAAVMIDLKTGGVLAMVSYPYFDPNWFITGDFMKHLQYLSTSGAEMNNVIQNPNYPGSTVKPANLIIGLENRIIFPDTVFDDTTGPLWIGNYPMKEDASYGQVSDVRAIGVSDDKFFYSLGLNLGKWYGSSSSSGGYPFGGNFQNWRDTSFIQGIMKLVNGEMRLGLGMLTGIDLPYEQSGSFYIEDGRFNPSKTITLVPKDINAALKKSGSYLNYGSPLDLALMAFGQGQQFTPIELVQYVSTIANNGKKLQPHLLQSLYPSGIYQNLKDSGLNPISLQQPIVQANVQINPKYLKIAQEGMYAACNAPDGTAYPTFHDAPYKAAGKTGTAEIVMHGQQINNSVFIGYAPFDHPEVAVAVMVPGAGWGATTAVPIARQMLDDYFKEHHAAFFPKNQWGATVVPKNWLTSPAYKIPEETK